METARFMQLTGLMVCLVLVFSQFCYAYPGTDFSSPDDENAEQGIREMLQELERQGLIRFLMPKSVYHPISKISNGHEIMTRKVLRSGPNSNMRLRYGKRSFPIMTPYGVMNIAGVGDVAESIVKGTASDRAIAAAVADGKNGNWKVNDIKNVGGGTNDFREQE